MIVTLTLNPALDRTLITQNFRTNEVNRVLKVNLNAGGKGINASRVIHALGGETLILTVLAGSSGKELLDMIEKSGIPHNVVWVDGNTRVNTKIVDIEKNTCTDVNEVGAVVTHKDWQTLATNMNNDKMSFLILAGSVHESLGDSIYKDIINSTNKAKTKTILDASGSLLKEGIKAKPWMIKPNIDELSELLDIELNSIEKVIQHSKNLINTGIQYVCVSMGADGLILIGNDKSIHAKPPKVIAKSTVGAGDSVVGSLATSFEKGENIEEALKKACAVSAASVTLDGTEMPSKELIQEYYSQVEICMI